MHVRFNLKNFLNWLTYSVDVRVYPSLRVLTFKLCVGFMALLVLFSALILGTSIAFSVRDRVIHAAQIYQEHFPEARIEKGMLLVDNDTPVIYKSPKYHVVMDVKADDYKRDKNIPVAVFLFHDRMVIDAADTEPMEVDYPAFSSMIMKINADTIEASKTLFALAALIFWTFIVFIDWSMQTALMTMIGSFVVGIVAAFFHILLPRNEQLKIALTAAVPVTVILLIEHILLLREQLHPGISRLPPSLYALNLLIFAVFLIFGSRGYLLPFLPKNPD